MSQNKPHTVKAVKTNRTWQRQSKQAAHGAAGLHRPKAAAVLGTRAEPPKRVKMRLRRIALVLGEAVAGVEGLQPQAVGVARGLGENRRRRDQERLRVALDGVPPLPFPVPTGSAN